MKAPFRLTAWPRIHLGLLDCGETTPRVFGGSGISLETESECTRLEVSTATSFQLCGLEQLDERGQQMVEESIARLTTKVPLAPIRVNMTRVIRQHVGLGSRTATILGTLRAISLGAGVSLRTKDLQEFSGRGGASGVGIHTFFTGGFVADSGRKRSPQTKILPSGAQIASLLPLLSVHSQVPNSWVFWLVLPEGSRLHGESEVAFFKENSPIPDEEVIEAIVLTHHGIVPAIIEGDLPAFASALKGLQTVGFKRREIDGQSKELRSLLTGLLEIKDVAAGMSSMGPLIFAVSDSADNSARDQITNLSQEYGARILASAVASNTGHVVEPLT